MDVAPSGTIDTFPQVKGCDASASSPGGSNASDRSITLTLMDTDVLDCSICFEPLSSPIFQCSNGHIACSSCRVKIVNKCPTCSLPIGDNRCRALEKVLESVRLTCKFSSYGCKETLSYYKWQEHDMSCFYAPCNCPYGTCSFIGSSKQLFLHLTSQHQCLARSFRFNTFEIVYLGLKAKFFVLHEENEDALFLLFIETGQIRNKITTNPIGPISKRYDLQLLFVREQELFFIFKAIVRCTNDPSRSFQHNPYFLIPKWFFGSEKITERS